MPTEFGSEIDALFEKMVREEKANKQKDEPGFLTYNNKFLTEDTKDPKSSSTGATETSPTSSPVKSSPSSGPTSGVGIRKSVTTPNLYAFPIDDPSVERIRKNLRKLSNEQLLSVLQKITYEKLPSTGDYIPYPHG